MAPIAAVDETGLAGKLLTLKGESGGDRAWRRTGSGSPQSGGAAEHAGSGLFEPDPGSPGSNTGRSGVRGRSSCTRPIRSVESETRSGISRGFEGNPPRVERPLVYRSFLLGSRFKARSLRTVGDGPDPLTGLAGAAAEVNEKWK